MRLLIVSLLGAIASVCGAAHNGIQPPSAAHHQRLANRSPAGFSSSLTERNLTAVEEPADIASVLGKRAFKNAHCTYYRAGLGACGWTNNSAQHIVALNRFQFEQNKGWPAPQCGKWIKICYKGKCTSAEVVDLCPDAQCNYGALDLSESLFVFLAGSTGPGIIYTEWEWSDGSGGSTPKPTSTSTKPKPTSTSTKTTTTKTTSKYTPPPEHETSTTTKSHSSEANLAPTSTRTSTSTTTTTSSSSTPTPTPDEPEIDNTASMLQAMLGMSYLLQGASLEVHTDGA